MFLKRSRLTAGAALGVAPDGRALGANDDLHLGANELARGGHRKPFVVPKAVHVVAVAQSLSTFSDMETEP